MRSLSDIRAAFMALPIISIEAFLAVRCPLILAPHPDDESLGCGGLIAMACAVGLHPVVVILTDGAASHPGSRAFPPLRLRALREEEAKRAACLLGLPEQNLYFLQAPDTKLPCGGHAFHSLLAHVLGIGRSWGCGMVIGPWGGDPHCDHEAGAVLAAYVAAGLDAALLSYPVWGWLRDGAEMFDEPRIGGWRLDIAQVLDRKQAAIAAHESQHGTLIRDAEDGFSLPENLIEISTQRFEVFIR